MLAILFLGAILRLYNLDRYPLWYDEASVALEEKGISSLAPVHKFMDPGFYVEKQGYLYLYNHVFIYYWKKIFGNSVFNLRLSSVIWGILGLYMFYWLARCIYNKNVALISVFLLAISPFHLQYSQELRPYAAVSFFSLAAFFALFNILIGKGKKYWVFFVVANTLNIYLLSTTFPILLAQIIFVLILKPERKKLLGLSAAVLAILLLTIPVVLIIIPNLVIMLTKSVDLDLTEFPLWWQKIGFVNLLFTLRNFSLGYYVNFFSPVGLITPLILFFLFVRGNYKDSSKPRVLFNTTMLAFPILSIFLVSKLVKVFYIDRYFLCLLPIYILVAARGLDYYRKWLRYVLLIVITALTSVGIRNYYLDLLPSDYQQHIAVMPKNNEISQLAGFLAENYKSGDKVFCTSKLMIFSLKFYLNGLEERKTDKIVKELISEGDEGKLIWFDDKNGLRQFFYKDSRPISVISQPFRSSTIDSRIWVINGLFDSRLAAVEKLKKDFVLKEKRDFKGLELYLFVLQG